MRRKKKNLLPCYITYYITSMSEIEWINVISTSLFRQNGFHFHAKRFSHATGKKGFSHTLTHKSLEVSELRVQN